ncbi:uncharacterized protein [Montipora capricornis]|uniref:uncharacterized protein isoform X1 n=2 Tax=Montipora capricornis TaxID=246305 RepID=UPI0035F20FEE
MFATLFEVLVVLTVLEFQWAKSVPAGEGGGLDTDQGSATKVNSTLLLRCGKKTIQISQTSGSIRSPNYPQGYDKDMRCTWHLQVPRGFQIKVRFRRQFHIEQSPGCSKDRIMLSTTKQFRNPLIYCGGVRPHGIIIPHNSVWIRFRSDNTTSGRGFYMSYTSIDENECKRAVCTFPSLCRNTVGSYACDCPEGYANKGRKASTRCEDIDECKIGNGRCDHKCINTDGSYHCMCKRGYKQAHDGRKCRADQNECSDNNGGCSHLCINSRSTYYCSCPPGFTLHSDKKTCYPVISFNHGQYTVGLSENSQIDNVVTKVEARTFPLQRVITYQLLSENLQRPSMFAINSRTGEILLKGRLDRGKTSNFLLQVQASFQEPNTSNGNKYLSAESFVLINVREQQSGEKLAFNRTSYNVKVPCNTSRDTVIYRMRVANTGGLGNNRLRYKFQKRLDYFYMTHHGKIKVQRSLLLLCYLTPSKSFKTTVIVRDAAGIKRNAHTSINIMVIPPGAMSKETVGIAEQSKDPITRLRISHSGPNMERRR